MKKLLRSSMVLVKKEKTWNSNNVCCALLKIQSFWRVHIYELFQFFVAGMLDVWHHTRGKLKGVSTHQATRSDVSPETIENQWHSETSSSNRRSNRWRCEVLKLFSTSRWAIEALPITGGGGKYVAGLHHGWAINLPRGSYEKLGLLWRVAPLALERYLGNRSQHVDQASISSLHKLIAIWALVWWQKCFDISECCYTNYCHTFFSFYQQITTKNRQLWRISGI